MGEGAGGRGAGRRRWAPLTAALLAAVLVVGVAVGCTSSGDPVAGGSATTAPSAGAPAGPATSVAPFAPLSPPIPVAYPAQPAGVAWPTAGWETAPLPATADAARVDALVTQALGPDSTGLNSNTDAVLVVHRGKVVLERYRPGFGDASTIHRSWSMAKSITGTLAGILVRDGRLDVRAPAPVAAWSDPTDPRHAITTEQLLRMASGLQWKEEYFVADSDTVAMLGGVGKDDQAAFAAAKPLEVPPGTRVRYSTGTSNIVAGIIGDEVGRGDPYRQFIQDRLLDPLGIPASEVVAGFDASGNLIGGSKFDTTARNFAKLGYLHLRGGEWDGTRIVDTSWVDDERTATPAPAGTPGYGAHWWIDPDHPTRWYMSGLAGQHVLVVPEHDLVVVVLADRYDGKEGQLRDELVDAIVGPASSTSASSPAP